MNFKSLWNCKENFYSDCNYMVLQRAVDYIKINYNKILGKMEGLRNDMDLPLQRRITNNLLVKCGFIEKPMFQQNV